MEAIVSGSKQIEKDNDAGYDGKNGEKELIAELQSKGHARILDMCQSHKAAQNIFRRPFQIEVLPSQYLGQLVEKYNHKGCQKNTEFIHFYIFLLAVNKNPQDV